MAEAQIPGGPTELRLRAEACRQLADMRPEKVANRGKRPSFTRKKVDQVQEGPRVSIPLWGHGHGHNGEASLWRISRKFIDAIKQIPRCDVLLDHPYRHLATRTGGVIDDSRKKP
jgi:hypothetical protein